MSQIPTRNFLDRVVTSLEKVTFSFADPYGHLSTSRYVEMFVNHRISAVEEKAGLHTLGLLKELKLAMVFQEIRTSFLTPALIGENLEIESWITAVEESGFTLKGVIWGTKNRRAKSVLSARLRSMDLESGRPKLLPPHLPGISETDLLSLCPTSKDYLKGLKGIPAGFRENGPGPFGR